MDESLQTYLVEDNAVIRASLVAALEELAPVTIIGTAVDEPSAVEWLKSHRNSCDLAIIDIFLKKGSGIGVLRAARDASTSAKLVVLSNYATAEVRQRCLDLGASRVFDKSSEIDELVSYCVSLANRLQ